MAAQQIQRVNHRHEAIIDFLLASPGEKNLQVLCDALNVSRSWLSIVMRSDAFRAEYERRRSEYNQELAETVQAKMYAVASKALDVVLESLDDDELDPRFALDAVDKTTNRLGFGAKPGNSPIVEMNVTSVNVVDKIVLAEARQAMKTVVTQRDDLDIIDALPNEG